MLTTKDLTPLIFNGADLIEITHREYLELLTDRSFSNLFVPENRYVEVSKGHLGCLMKCRLRCTDLDGLANGRVEKLQESA